MYRVLITGTSHGIGKATAKLFLEKGYTVAGFDKEPSTIDHKYYEHHQLDIVTDPLPPLKDLIFIVNNAGVLYDIDKPMETNLIGAFRVEDAYVKQNINSLEAIVNVSSIAALDGQDEREYCCSKGAILSYNVYLANELAKFSIRVNCVIPGAGETDMNKLYITDPQVYSDVAHQNLMGRWGSPNENAKAIYFLCADATFTTGETLLVDGGELIKNRYIRGEGERRPYDLV